MKLSEKIVRLRKSRGMTQEEMAERCAVTRQSISKWEVVIALPETEKLLMLSEIFGVPLDTLLRDERTLDAVRDPPMRPECRKKRCTRAFSSKKARRTMPRTTGLRISRRGIGNDRLSRKGAHLSNRKRSGEGARLRGLPGDGRTG